MVEITSKKLKLREFRKEDKDSLRKNINNKKIYDNTLNIPYPYTEKHARKWIDKCLEEKKEEERKRYTFAIDVDDEVVGGISLDHVNDKKAELGYWLAEKHWGKGIMTEAVKLITEYAFNKLGLKRIYAYVFPPNKASAKVLEKNGFKYEGRLRKHAEKEGILRDELVYGKLSED